MKNGASGSASNEGKATEPYPEKAPATGPHSDPISEQRAWGEQKIDNVIIETVAISLWTAETACSSSNSNSLQQSINSSTFHVGEKNTKITVKLRDEIFKFHIGLIVRFCLTIVFIYNLQRKVVIHDEIHQLMKRLESKKGHELHLFIFFFQKLTMTPKAASL